VKGESLPDRMSGKVVQTLVISAEEKIKIQIAKNDECHMMRKQ